ncbi:MAG: alpha/beta fold hydrolase [Actinomycetota bacterium]
MSDWQPLSGPLAAERTGDHRAHTLVFVHGFTHTGNSWKPIAEQFVTLGYQAVLVDLPGPGGSSAVRADLRRSADMVAALGGRGTYIGYSLGGRVVLHLGLMYPHLAQTLVLLGAHPGFADADERAARRASDDALAEHLLDVGLEAFLGEWTALPLFGGFEFTAADRSDRMRNTADGLAASLRMAGNGEQLPLWPRLRELNMPVLAMAGADDTKFAAIAEQIANAVPTGRIALIPGAAHAAHLQNPQAVVAAIAAVLPA